MMGQDSQAPSTPGNQATEEITIARQQPPPAESHHSALVDSTRTVSSGVVVPFPLQPPPVRGTVGNVMGGERAGTIRGTFEVMTPGHGPLGPLVPQPTSPESLFVPSVSPRGSASAPLSPQDQPMSPQGFTMSSSSFPQYGPRASSVPIPDQGGAISRDPAFFSGRLVTTASHSSRPHIPNIIIEQVSARDSFGHSRTPPFTLSQFSPWQLGIPGNGRKNRTNSDSALYDVEKEQQQQQQSRTSQSSTSVSAMMPVLSPSLSSERLHLEHIRIADSPTKDSYSATYQFPPHQFHQPLAPSTSASFSPINPKDRREEEAQRMARQISQGFVVEEQRESAMEVETSDLERSSEVKQEEERFQQTQESEKEDRGLHDVKVEIESETMWTTCQSESEHTSEKEIETVEKPKVPFLWKFQPEKLSLSQSPKTFWLRRHSDSNLPTQPQNLTVSHEQRSYSTGESHEPLHHRGDEGETSSGSEAPKTRESTGDSFRSSLSESTEASDYRTDPNWSAKRMKLKKTLLKRYQLQSEESPGSAQHSLESDDVFSPSPGVFSARAFSFSPERIHSLQQSEKSSTSQREAKAIIPQPTSSSVSTHAQKPVDLSSSSSTIPVPSPTGGGQPEQPVSLHPQPASTSISQYSFSTIPKPVGKVGRPVRPLYVKTETVSSSDSGEMEEVSTAETPVFFSPSMFSPRLYYDSPRQVGTGSVFQFHSTHSRSPSLEKSDTPSPPRSARSPFLHSPSPLSHDQPRPPPFHRSPSPRSQEAVATQGPASSSQVTKKAALVRDISAPYGSSSSTASIPTAGIESEVSPKPRVLPHSPRESQSSPLGPYIMPTIKEHSQPQASPALAAFSVSETQPLSQQQLSASAPAGFLSFHQAATSTQSGLQQGMEQHRQHQYQMAGELRTSPQGMIGVPPLEAMLRHPSFTLSQLPQRSKHLGSGDMEKTGIGSPQFGDVKPAQQSALVRGSSTVTGVSMTPFQSYSGGEGVVVPKSSVLPSDNTGLQQQWTSSETTEAPSPRSKKSDSGKPMDASKIIYCPFSEKVQEQRYQQDPHQNFVCPVCGQMFPSFNYLANHMVNHLPSETVTRGPGEGTKIHICKVCNKSFSRSDMLTRHMRLHTGLRPYECRVCGQVFSRSDHLHTHMRTHTGEKPYRCPQCPYAAPRRDMITRHMRIHMKTQKRSGGRRNSSTGSADTQQSSSFSSQESADFSEQLHQQHQKRRGTQSLSSLESMSMDSPLEASPSFRHGSSSDIPQSPDYYEGIASRRHWSVESGASSDILPSPSTPGFGSFSHHWEMTPKKRSWSATSMETDLPRSPSVEGKQVAEQSGDSSGKEQQLVSQESETRDTDSTIVSSGTSCETSPDSIHQRSSGAPAGVITTSEGVSSAPKHRDYRVSIVKTEPTGDIAYRSISREEIKQQTFVGALVTEDPGTLHEMRLSESSHDPVEGECQLTDEGLAKDMSSTSQKEAQPKWEEGNTGAG